MPNPERRPEEEALKFLGGVDMKTYSEEMRLAKKLAIASLALGAQSYSQKPVRRVSLETLRAEMDRQLPGVSFSTLITNEQVLGY